MYLKHLIHNQKRGHIFIVYMYRTCVQMYRTYLIFCSYSARLCVLIKMSNLSFTYCTYMYDLYVLRDLIIIFICSVNVLYNLF